MLALIALLGVGLLLLVGMVFDLQSFEVTLGPLLLYTWVNQPRLDAEPSTGAGRSLIATAGWGWAVIVLTVAALRALWVHVTGSARRQP
jgi:hypothetical protein